MTNNPADDPKKVLIESFQKLDDDSKQEIAKLAVEKLYEENITIVYSEIKEKFDELISIMNYIHDAVWCFEFDRSYIYKAVYLSPNIAKLTGYQESYFDLNDDKNWIGIIHPPNSLDSEN